MSIKKVLAVVAVVVLVFLVFQSTFFQGIYYKGKISQAETVDVEIGEDLNARLSEDQLGEIKMLLTNASWKSVNEDLATTHYLMFDDDLLVGILDSRADELAIGIGRNQYLLTGVEGDIYSVIFAESE